MLRFQYNLVLTLGITRWGIFSAKSGYFYYAIHTNNFNDEGQERGFWIHDISDNDIDYTEEPDPYVYKIDNPNRYQLQSFFYKTPYREFLTIHFTDTDITAINLGQIDEVAMNYWRWNGAVTGKIVRILYECSAEKHKAFNTALLEKTLYEDGAFYVSGITPEKIESSDSKIELIENILLDFQRDNEDLRDVSNKRQKWTDEELKIVLSDAPTKKNCMKYARLFKRGYGSIEQIYRWSTTPNKELSDERKEDSFIQQIKKIAKELGLIG